MHACQIGLLTRPCGFSVPLRSGALLRVYCTSSFLAWPSPLSKSLILPLPLSLQLPPILVLNLLGFGALEAFGGLIACLDGLVGSSLEFAGISEVFLSSGGWGCASSARFGVVRLYIKDAPPLSAQQQQDNDDDTEMRAAEETAMMREGFELHIILLCRSFGCPQSLCIEVPSW